MDHSEAYAFLFTDVVFSNLVITARSEIALPVMKALGFYSNHVMLLYAFLGIVSAFILNYIFGIVLYNLYRFSTDQKIMERYLKLADIFKKYGILLLTFSFIPNIGKFIPLVAGFTRFGIIQTVLYAAIGKMLYYAWFLYY
jgi:membrane protein YqaA with SNARE-associated domain